MKLLIASDIHGSAYYCEKMLQAYEKEQADKLLLLGDILYHGPRNDLPRDYAPKQVIGMLNPRKEELLCVRGNCDTEVDEMISEFKLEDNIELKINGVNFFFSHGHKYNMDNVPPVGKVVVYGHFHTGFITEEYGTIFANPGSISLPKNNTKHSYLIIDEKELILKDVEGNIIDRKIYMK